MMVNPHLDPRVFSTEEMFGASVSWRKDEERGVGDAK
jgi:hypothetical protein